LLDQLSATYHVTDQLVALSACGGVAMAPDEGCAAAELLQNAELALSEAIERGSGGIVFYDETDHQLRERGGAIARQLVQAIARDELKLHFQPLVDCASGQVCAAEALVRWDSPELGPVPPSEFVPLAEESGLMTQIGGWVLTTACRQLRQWLDEGLRPIRLAVNVSLCQLLRGDLASQVRALLAETAIDPSLLELELSERGTLRNDPDILHQLREIKQLGVRLAIDDFGTGNTGIWYLRSLPLDTLKIDQSFVKSLASSPEDAAIATATIAMARQLGLRVVAEGVEERQQMDLLRAGGCHEVQGFLFFPALSANDLGALLASDPHAPTASASDN
jgi:EAL domain-containing protein (putative c-di-GMP-specific phosphodiesterase class I)